LFTKSVTKGILSASSKTLPKRRDILANRRAALVRLTVTRRLKEVKRRILVLRRCVGENVSRSVVSTRKQIKKCSTSLDATSNTPVFWLSQIKGVTNAGVQKAPVRLLRGPCAGRLRETCIEDILGRKSSGSNLR